jgi:hypothetical protein
MVLAKDPEKAKRRMVERDRKRGKSDDDIKRKLRTSVNRAFYIVTPNVNDKYFDKKEDVEKLTQREKRITKSINSIL